MTTPKNALEKLLIHAVRDAQKAYLNMTGQWLWHGPESFLQNSIALTLSGPGTQKKPGGFYVFPECSPETIKEEMGKKVRGPQPRNKNQRFDLVVWHRTTTRVRAIIEIKRTGVSTGLNRDAEKIRKHLGGRHIKPKCGYLLLYTEKKDGGRKEAGAKIDDLFKGIAKETGARKVAHFIFGRQDNGWLWGCALYRIDRLECTPRMRQ